MRIYDGITDRVNLALSLRLHGVRIFLALIERRVAGGLFIRLVDSKGVDARDRERQRFDACRRCVVGCKTLTRPIGNERHHVGHEFLARRHRRNLQ